jgi:hypothetical protein
MPTRWHQSYKLSKQTKQARRLLLKIDIEKGRANAIQYKGALQWMDDVLRRLTFED